MLKNISSYKKGLLMEMLVIFILFIKGYKILKHRFKTKYGEIDIILLKNETLIFLEVKYRKNIDALTDVLTNKQINRIYKASQYFIRNFSRKKDFKNFSLRYDLFFIGGLLKMQHIKNISFDFKL